MIKYKNTSVGLYTPRRESQTFDFGSSEQIAELENDLNSQKRLGSSCTEAQTSPALCSGAWHDARGLREELRCLMSRGLQFWESFTF